MGTEMGQRGSQERQTVSPLIKPLSRHCRHPECPPSLSQFWALNFEREESEIEEKDHLMQFKDRTGSSLQFSWAGRGVEMALVHQGGMPRMLC